MYGLRLSKEEIDMLLLGITEGRLSDDAADAAQGQRIEVYQLSGLKRVNLAHLPGLEEINRRICRDAAVSLADFAGRPAQVVCERADVKEYGKFLAAIEPVQALCIFTLAPFSGHGSLILEDVTADMLVDAYFGGRAPFQLARQTAFAPLSCATLNKAEARLMDVIRSGWGGFEPAFERLELLAYQQHLISDAASVYVSTFKLIMSGIAGRFYISIPVDSIKPAADVLVNTCSDDERAAWADAMAEGLYDAPVDITVEMGAANITVEELLSLKSGDIIETERRVKDPVDILIRGMPLLTGLPGAYGSRYAIRVAGENILHSQGIGVG